MMKRRSRSGIRPGSIQEQTAFRTRARFVTHAAGNNSEPPKITTHHKIDALQRSRPGHLRDSSSFRQQTILFFEFDQKRSR